MNNSNNKIEKMLARLLLILVSSMLCLTTSEIIYRTIVKEKILKDAWMLSDDNHVPRPYVMAAGKPGSQIYDDFHNELGYRGALPILPKPKKEFRIFVLGGSTVHFNQIDVPKHLENAAHQEILGKNIKAYNFGIASSVSQQDLIRLVTDLVSYTPDLIIHYGAGNDIFAAVDPRINYPHRFSLYEKKIYEGQSVRQYPFIHNLLLGSQIYRDLFTEEIKKIDFEETGFSTPPYTQTEDLRIKAYTQNMLLMNHISNSFGIKFISIIQPMVQFKKNAGTALEGHFLNDVNHVQLQEERRKNILMAFSQSHFPYADCTHIYDNEKEGVYSDYIHLMDGKDSRPAQCIWEALKEKKLLIVSPVSKIVELVPAHLFYTGY